MRTRILALACATLLAACGADEEQQAENALPAPPVDTWSEGTLTADGATIVMPGLYAPIRLAGPGASARLALRSVEAGYISAQVLDLPPELGALSFAATTATGEAVDLSDRVAEQAGEYRIMVTASGAWADAFAIKLDVAPVVDIFEPNETEAEARPLSLPVALRLTLDPGNDTDWFAFEGPTSGVVMVQFSGDATVAVRRPGVEAADVVTSGTRHYFEAATGAWRLQVRPPENGRYSPDGIVRLSVTPFTIQAGAGQGLIVVGLSDDDPALAQLKLLMRTLGREVTVARTADEIAAALALAAAPPEPPAPVPTETASDMPTTDDAGDDAYPLWLILLAAASLAVIAGSAVAAWRVLRARKTPPGA